MNWKERKKKRKKENDLQRKERKMKRNENNIYLYKITSRIKLCKFLRRSLMIFIIKGFRTIFFIFIVISTTFRPICPPAFFRYLSNSGTFSELRTTSFIESTGVACSDFVSHNRVPVLSIPVLLLACSQD